MAEVLESSVPSIIEPRQGNDARAEAIAQRLAQFQETMDLIESIPDYRAEAGLGPIPDNIREVAYEQE